MRATPLDKKGWVAEVTNDFRFTANPFSLTRHATFMTHIMDAEGKLICPSTPGRLQPLLVRVVSLGALCALCRRRKDAWRLVRTRDAWGQQ